MTKKKEETKSKRWTNDPIKLIKHVTFVIGMLGSSYKRNTTLDFELGCTLFDLSDLIKDFPKLLKNSEFMAEIDKMKEAGDPLIQKLAMEEGDWGYYILDFALGPGQELFPDKKVHWWWWWHEEFMTEEEIKRFNKYLETRG